MKKAGEIIPLDIPVIDKDNKEITLKDLLTEKYLVLYFYPKDKTPGCTEEACSFRDNNELLKSLGARVVGVSMDSQKMHGKFIKKESLNFALLTDANHVLQEAFGVWGEKTMFGKTYMGTIRTTFLTDQSGKILATWGGESDDKVETIKHAEDVATKIKDL